VLNLQQTGIIWCFGLTRDQEKILHESLKGEYSLRSWPAAVRPDIADFDADKPGLHIFSVEGYKAYRERSGNILTTLDILPQVILLPANASAQDLQYALDSDCLAILRHDLTPERMLGKIEQLLEISEMQKHVVRMSREICLEREIYEHKNTVLQFLVNFQTQTAELQNVAEIMHTVFSCLNMLLPVRSQHLTLWEPGSNATVHMFITSPKESESFARWRSLMLEQLNLALPNPGLAGTVPNIFLNHLHLKDQEKEWRNAMPADGYVLHLPIALSGAQIGFLSILTDMERSLTRDQALALNAAMQYLGLALHKIYINRIQPAQAMNL
jgi:hypothetical protein